MDINVDQLEAEVKNVLEGIGNEFRGKKMVMPLGLRRSNSASVTCQKKSLNVLRAPPFHQRVNGFTTPAVSS